MKPQGPGETSGASSQGGPGWARWLLSVRLNPLRLGVAVGIAWGIAILATTLLHVTAGWFGPWVRLIGGHYLGLGPTVPGALVGLVTGFVEGIWVGIVFSTLWNVMMGRADEAVKKAEDEQD